MEKYFAYDDCVLSNQRRKHTGARPMCATCKAASGSSFVPLRSDTENGVEEKQRRTVPASGTASIEPQSELLRRRRKPALIRSKTFDPSLLSQVQSDTEAKLERKKSQSNQFSKTNTQYHKLFKEISKDEQLRQSYTCALQKDILYQGRLFVSDNWICFHSKVFGKDTKIVIPVLSIAVVKKTKTAILVPNALVIATSNERHVFVSFLSRDTTYKFLMSVCYHLEDFCADFSDLDGKVRKRRQEMEDSSSSDSHSPDSQKMADYSKLPQTLLNVTKPGELPVVPEPLQHSPETRNTPPYNGVPETAETAELAYDIKSLRPISLSALLMVYLFLVCVLVLSSCYMAFRIVSLEQRLTSLGSMSEPPENGNDYKRDYLEDNAEVYSMLSMNILKLEKLQRNLQRLLEETQ
ncbi:GRAM domain-containing protein 2B isoform X2 [Alosa alosa]|uniref:GRAM domain-containing protein 2B isoform X2 n=1 Tax=Alosa sapidissima TaxID=34773 RepID=UPI001C09C69F|nr:GRAM domain-containing protein 2B isoform X2 [Alosa sapidissima]XP_048098503.1 GRAM domain-containing protein 2B isoform X2 [Alosa alosa]